MRSLSVKKIFGPTIQGEGSESGTPSIFIRFSNCNMWDGRPETRAASACPYCDTDFFGGDIMTPSEIFSHVSDLAKDKKYLIVLSGGEPLLQPHILLAELLELLREAGHQRAVETNGTVDAPLLYDSLDFITCSPKVPWDKLKINKQMVTCWKMLYPHPSLSYDPIVDYASDNMFGVAKFYLQPVDSGHLLQSRANAKSASNLVKTLGYPWRLSVQVHKIIDEE
jgi:organic radical activating enzyme